MVHTCPLFRICVCIATVPQKPKGWSVAQLVIHLTYLIPTVLLKFSFKNILFLHLCFDTCYLKDHADRCVSNPVESDEQDTSALLSGQVAP